MNLIAKIKRLEARVAALERVLVQIHDCNALASTRELSTYDIECQYNQEEALVTAITPEKPIVSAIVEPPRRKRGRPPKS